MQTDLQQMADERPETAQEGDTKRPLLAFALAAVIPVVLFGAVLVYLLGQQYRDTSESQVAGMTRAIGTSVDQEFSAVRRVAETLALSPTLDHGSFPAFYDLAVRTMRANPELAKVALTDVESGEHVVHTDLGPGETIGASRFGLAQVREAVDAGRPVIASLQLDVPTTRQALIPVRAPVIREGRVRYVVTVALSPSALDGLFVANGFPENWMGMVVDPSGLIASRNTLPERYVGRPVRADIADKLRAGASGLFLTQARDGEKVYTAYTRSPVTGWTVVVGTPVGLINTPVQQSLLVLVLAGLVTVAIGALLAFQIGRSIRRTRQAEAALRRQLSSTVAERTQALQTSEAQLHLINDSLPILMSYIDTRLHLRYVNERHEEWFRRPASEMTGRHIREVIDEDEVYDICEPYMRAALRGEITDYEVTETFPDGKERRIRVRYLPVREEGGRIPGFLTLIEDVTERRQTEAQLLQSQKMESVGQLTGGVAHDFNNLMAVVRGNVEFLEDKLGSEEHLVAIRHATERGGELTQRLLAFARQQPLEPRIVDVGELIQNVRQLLRRVLGEMIEVAISPVSELWRARVDAGQLESAIVSLAINASEAMPDGGRLAIECQNATLDSAYVAANPDAQEGDYVVITVSDTGSGMTREVLEQAFNPFFTTKLDGKSSGLGLSVVYGFARQSGGHVRVYSEPGRGTQISVYLPRAEADEYPPASTENDRFEEPQGAGEKVLVVEDDADVRDLTVRMLTSLGYQPVSAEDGKSGMAMIAELDDLDVLLSDVVLPGDFNGPALAEKAQQKFPGVKLLFMSGYPAQAASDNSSILRRNKLLNKPFHREELAQALRAVIEGRG